MSLDAATVEQALKSLSDPAFGTRAESGGLLRDVKVLGGQVTLVVAGQSGRRAGGE